MLLLHNRDNDRTIRSLVSQPASAGKGVDMSDVQPHHCMTTEQVNLPLV